MSFKKGLTTWVMRTGGVTFAYRWNMRLGESCRTFRIIRGDHCTVACGPIMIEW